MLGVGSEFGFLLGVVSSIQDIVDEYKLERSWMTKKWFFTGIKICKIFGASIFSHLACGH